MKIRALLLALFVSHASALEIGNEDELASAQIHAFVGQGFLISHPNNYLVRNSKHGSFQFTEGGVNVTKQLGKLRVGLQLFAQNVGPTGNFEARMDWFYLDYRFKNWFGVRAGRIKIPFGLYNEYNDIDSARVPILLPQSVYPLSNRDYLLAQTGGEIYGYLEMKSAGALDYRAYGGTIFLDATTPPGSPYTVTGLTVPYLIGGRLMWETPLEGLRIGGSLQVLRLDADFLAGMKQVNYEIPAKLGVVSAEYAKNDLVVSAEYSRWYVSAKSSSPMTLPDQNETASERAYGMITYRASKWLQPGAYYSVLFPNADHRDGREHVQHDIATTLRFDINDHWLVKLEGHYMFGTAGFASALNDNVPLTDLRKGTGVFLVKTTAYF